MRKLFNSPFKITQAFGVNANYYGKFNLKGHEGIDLIPTTSDWTVFALEDGIVVKDDDIAGSSLQDVYGKYVTIWHPTINKATQYCHLEYNTVKLNQTVTRGQAIGKMGATGNTSGAHVHLNLFITDVNGIRQNVNNGFIGGIDPLPFLEEVVDQQAELDKLRTERDHNWNLHLKDQETIKNLNQIVNDKNRKIDELTSQLSARDYKVIECESRLSSLEEQAKKIPSLTAELEVAKSDRQLYFNQATEYEKQVRELKKTSFLTADFRTIITALINRFLEQK